MSTPTITFWSLTRGYRGRYVAALAALLVSAGLLYMVPLIPQVVIDGVLDPDQSGTPSVFVQWLVPLMGGREHLVDALWIPGVVVAALSIAAGLFTYLRGRWSAQASEGVIVDLRDRVFDTLQHLPSEYFDGHETGDLVQRCTSDVDTIRMFLANQMVEIGRAVLLLLLPIPLMLMIDPWMTLSAVVTIPFITAFSLLFFSKVRSLFRLKEEAEGRMTSAIQENLSGVRVVRAFARQDHEIQQFDQRNVVHRDLDYRLYALMARFWSLSDLMCMAQKAIVVGVGIILLVNGLLEIGSFYFFLTAVAMFIWPVRQMGRILSDLGRATVAFDRIRAILQAPRESMTSSFTHADPVGNRIEFDAVTFSHGASSPVLHEVSFSVEPGQTLAIVGPSGCGKSTIVNLLLRLYDYEQGSIRLGDEELDAVHRKRVRARIAVVLQEPFLFSKTLRENILLASPSAAEHEMHEATVAAEIHDSILSFEQGYETGVGERGVTLSGGQRQRVALARALLQVPDILVLDDALSAVDTETESVILEALKRRHHRQTTIVIAHRIATLMHADKVLVMDQGRVVQQGPHEQLILEEGLYRRLWEIQSPDAEWEVGHG
ncbi:MAG: ABC transporter ATP-binding protein [Phycisphaerales bacterium]|nr:ABC transporter ATP-binding protein [Phycisphaerales bacterium]